VLTSAHLPLDADIDAVFGGTAVVVDYAHQADTGRGRPPRQRALPRRALADERAKSGDVRLVFLPETAAALSGGCSWLPSGHKGFETRRTSPYFIQDLDVDCICSTDYFISST
jgi:hypothetical protein